MRIAWFAILAVTAGAAGGCGSAGSSAASRPAPPAPVTLSAYIGPLAVRIAPSRLGAGPVLLTVADRARRAMTLVIARAGSGAALVRSPAIGPDGVAQLKVDLPSGAYAVAAIIAGRHDDAQRARALVRARTTMLHVGAPRPDSFGQVLQP